jgi:hypothetical protein
MLAADAIEKMIFYSRLKGKKASGFWGNLSGERMTDGTIGTYTLTSYDVLLRRRA